jgi:hypothetical protein
MMVGVSAAWWVDWKAVVKAASMVAWKDLELVAPWETHVVAVMAD